MDITTMINTILPYIVGGSGVGAFMFYRETKLSKRLDNEKKRNDNDNSQAQQWKDLYFEAEKKSQGKSDKIGELYNTISKLTAEKIKLVGRLARISILRCDEMACPARRPPINTMSVGVDCTDCKPEHEVI